MDDLEIKAQSISPEGYEILTVRELIELLSKCDPEAIVYHEGCDCIGSADGVKNYDSPKRRAVLITRSN